ncbi:MAG TPA: FHA domain-containing protein [Candidatus Angelobacter sp.]|nr:FHA domain-containing protein [Candidatus Angelobacter sp.]
MSLSPGTGEIKPRQASIDRLPPWDYNSEPSKDEMEATQPSPSLSRLNYLVFVTTPTSSLVKTRVSMNFDDHPVISIGRGPGSIVVIQDQEVSRSHASLSFETSFS